MIEITMRLEDREAQAIRTLTEHVGGSREGPRGLIDELMVALGKAGIRRNIALERPPEEQAHGRFYFVNKWPDKGSEKPRVEVKRK